MEMNDTTPPQGSQPRISRQARGSYSKLICLNCRSRKIKCILPVQDESIQPSGSPQPPDKACIRCQQQNLECIIDRTILGRPSSKRKQNDDGPSIVRTKSIGGSEVIIENAEDDAQPDDANVAGFVLSEVEVEIDQVAAEEPSKDRPESHTLYQSLIDPYHLISTVIVRDKKFGAACNAVMSSTHADPVRLLKGPLIDIVDERLVWLRLYYPYIPKISTLLKEALTPTWQVLAPALSMKALVLVLMLIAVDAKSNDPPPKELDRQSIVSALARCGLELLFTPPVHRHTIYALQLIMEYCPTALVTGQNAAAPSLRGELYVLLMKSVADKIDLKSSSNALRAKLSSPATSTEEISQLVNDSLLWAKVCHYAVSVGALITKLPPDLVECSTTMHDSLAPVGMALNQYVHLSSAVKFLYMRMMIRASALQAAIDIKLHANDLHFLSAISSAHQRTAADQKRMCSTLLDRNKNAAENDVVRELISNEVDQFHQEVGQHVISFGVLSDCLTDDLDPKIEDVIRISDLMIENIKLATWESPSSAVSDDSDKMNIPTFLAKLGPGRPGQTCQQLRNYIRAGSTFTLNGYSWQPPSREMACACLYLCKLLTEENAARMKGWGWLCEDVDTQLLLFEDIARVLSKMDIVDNQSLEQGSVFAACAKLIRSLGTIVGKWKNRLLERFSKQIAGELPAGAPPSALEQAIRAATKSTAGVTSATPPGVVNADLWQKKEREAMQDYPLPTADTTGIYAAIDDAWSNTNMPTWTEVNFDDWAAWPQANNVDFWDPYTQGDMSQNISNQYGFG